MTPTVRVVYWLAIAANILVGGYWTIELVAIALADKYATWPSLMGFGGFVAAPWLAVVALRVSRW